MLDGATVGREPGVDLNYFGGGVAHRWCDGSPEGVTWEVEIREIVRYSPGSMTTESNSSDICRVLSIVDGVSEEVVDVIELPHFSVETFSRQFDVPVETDPDMHDRYAVGPDDVEFLRREVGIQMVFDFSRYGYFIEAVYRR